MACVKALIFIKIYALRNTLLAVGTGMIMIEMDRERPYIYENGGTRKKRGYTRIYHQWERKSGEDRLTDMAGFLLFSFLVSFLFSTCKMYVQNGRLWVSVAGNTGSGKHAIVYIQSGRDG